MCQIYWSIRISKEHQAVKDYLQRKGMTPGEKDEDKMMVWTLDGDTLSARDSTDHND